MSHGFLGHDASFMLDLVVCALFLLVPLLGLSLWLVLVKSRYRLHKTLQISLAVLLFTTIIAFEIDLQFVHGGWINIVNKNPDSPRLTGGQLDLARDMLRLHLVFAISTPPLWGATIYLALRHFPAPPRPAAHSLWHARLGWASAIDLLLTSVTGIAFYYVAFVMS